MSMKLRPNSPAPNGWTRPLNVFDMYVCMCIFSSISYKKIHSNNKFFRLILEDPAMQ